MMTAKKMIQLKETKVCHKDALNSCGILKKYLEQQNVDYSSQVKLINDIKSIVNNWKDNCSQQTSILNVFNIKNYCCLGDLNWKPLSLK